MYIFQVCSWEMIKLSRNFSSVFLSVLDFKMYRLRLSIIPIFYISITITTFSILCDARSFAQFFKPQDTKLHKSKSIHELEKNKLKAINHLDLHFALASPNIEFQPFDASSPFSSPPLDSPAPGHLPLPAPNSVSPPIPPNPSLANPPPSGPTSSPIPNPPQNGPSPHPPTTISTPPKSVLSPPVLPPPIAFPPPSGPPSPPQKKPPQFAVWCVVKPTVPDPIIQEALDYACGSGADCKSIRPNGSCYQPNTLLSHASYAFNSYWQNTKIAGGTCDFGGTAMLVTVDPSYDECNFFFNG